MKIGIDGVFVVRGRGIPSFRMSTNPTNAVTKYLFWGNVEGFEYHAVQVFLELTRHSKIFFDIGANIGYYSLLASSVSEKKIKVFAFEPMPPIFEFLVQNIKLNGFDNIQPQRLALSSEAGQAQFYAVSNPKFPHLPQLTGDGSLNSEASASAPRVSVNVAVNTLDDFVDEYLGGEKIDLIKLDTEANEHRVLAGAKNVLTYHRPVIQCEILKDQIEEEVEKILKPHNFLFFLATDKGLKRVMRLKYNDTNFQDYYFVPAEKMESLAKLKIRFL